jgi:hypothetical protein
MVRIPATTSTSTSHVITKSLFSKSSGGTLSQALWRTFAEARLMKQLSWNSLKDHGCRVLEMVWLIAHANHHAWQVNYLFEAAMFGSILDGGKLIGKLDRKEQY